ncbi:MAG TPA: DNA repair protein RadC [Candidatus Nanoarchaeia archaeon]|nr:DNA repair protein RadC [Candidatus Nanoarchaeia archaeon]
MLMKDIALEQRPRERLKSSNSSFLSDPELLALILEKGTKGENVLDLSNRLISSFGLENLNSLSLQELMKIKGIGLAKGAKIIAAFELSKRVNSGKICEKVIKNPSDIASYYIEKLKDLKKEHFIAVFLDSKNKIIKDEVISIGTLNSSLVHPREVFKEAIKNSANSIILVHNHPSGNVEPSDEDYRVNRVLVETGDLIGIKVLDHLIVGNHSYNSLIVR